MNTWMASYLASHKAALDTIPLAAVARLAALLHKAQQEDRQIFVCGNGWSAANASHFATDLGKGASDKLGKRFRVVSLNDNVSWLTALGNDYAYDDVFVRQLENYARAQDILWVMSVSGNSPNLVKAARWAKAHRVHIVALVGGKPCALGGLADDVLAIGSDHYGRVEDCHMGICHLVCYAFMENALA